MDQLKGFDGENSRFLDSSRFCVPNKIYRPEPLKNLSFSDVNKEDFRLNGSKSKGLRDLSLKVKRIIENEGNTTYKQVAEKLVQKQGCHKKEEQNVRRRVYDALNVLIAAGVIVKQKKYLTATQDTFKNGKQQYLHCRCLNKDKWDQIKKDQAKKNEMQQRQQNKKQYLVELTKKIVKIDQLVQQNTKSLPNSQIAEQYQLHNHRFIKKEDDPVIIPFSQQSYHNFPEIKTDEPDSTPIQLQKFQFPLITFWGKVDDVINELLKVAISNKMGRIVRIHSNKLPELAQDVDILENADLERIPRIFSCKFADYYAKLHIEN